MIFIQLIHQLYFFQEKESFALYTIEKQGVTRFAVVKYIAHGTDGPVNDGFKVGDKLVVTGKVIPKAMTSLDQSSSNPSGNTQTGHSYSTNYAQSVMNYVEVTIPYPKSMFVNVPSIFFI